MAERRSSRTATTHEREDQQRHATSRHRQNGEELPSLRGELPSLSTTAMVGLAVALLEPELLVGMGIGVAAMAIPKLLPAVSNVFRPVMKSAVRAGYATVAKTRELAAEAGEEIEDVIAEARSEYGSEEPEVQETERRSERGAARRRAS